MRNYRLTLILAVLASSVAFYACNKYKDALPPSSDLPEDKIVIASVQGSVLDENGLPVQGATVTSGTASTTTDENGVFNFSDISLSSRFGYVKAVKQGYFTGSRSILTSAASSNYISIKLIPRTSKGSFSASTGGSIAVQTGDTVAFDASSVVTAATNAAYSGTVHVYAYYLDPLAKDGSSHMPGDLRGIGADGKETFLQSFGMMVVELEGDGGEKLQIAAGKVANISMKIPDVLKATAAATIPLWYFNDTTGRWIEQGKATRKDGQYCGQTSHFTWWNCDAPTGTVSVKLHVKDPKGTALAYTYLQFNSPTYGTRSGYTDVNGYAEGLIPKGEMLQLQIFGFCGNIIGGANIGPALTNQDLGTVVTSDTVSTLTLKGTVVNCNGDAVDSGYVSIYVEGKGYRAAVTKGAFSLGVTRCNGSSTSIVLVPGDYKALQQGNPVTISATIGETSVGQLTACGITADAFISVTVDGNTYKMTSPPDSVIYANMGSFANFFALPYAKDGYPANYKYIGWDIDPASGPGTYAGRYFVMSTGTQNYSSYDMQCVISDFGPVNGFVSGSISATVKDTTNLQMTYPLTGTFKVKRMN